MANVLPHSLSDRDLLIETGRAAGVARQATASLLALLAEVDSRRLYLGEGFSSLFAYATGQLHFSEPEAYSRISAARIARRFPRVLTMLADGELSLTTVGLLAAHLTDDNHEAFLDAARHKSKREVEALVAALHPQPDIMSSVRALPPQRATSLGLGHFAAPPAASLEADRSALLSTERQESGIAPKHPSFTQPRIAAVVAPIAPSRYLIRLTVGEETKQKLARARDLLRHAVPDGDLAVIFDRALTALLDQTERAKFGAVARPRTSRNSGTPASSRRIPAAVRRAVWKRDRAQCAFVGTTGRCAETGALEFHHVVPFASGGSATADNIQLRCRAHNQFEGALLFGDWRDRTQDRGRANRTPSGRS